MRILVVLTIGAAVLVGACASGTALPSTSAAVSPSTSPSQSTTPTEPTASTPAPPTTASEPPAEPTLAPPPDAILVVGGTRQVGRVGSYVWAGGSDAAPWLPASALHPVAAAAGATGAVEVERDARVESWSARMAAADDPTAARPTPLGSGTGDPTFPLPGRGDWVVAVHVVFADGLGDATWYWHVVAR